MAKIEVFSAGCPLCQPTVETVKGASAGHDVVIHDLRDDQTAEESATGLGIKTVPAVVVDGQLLSCCAGRGFKEEELVKALS